MTADAAIEAALPVPREELNARWALVLPHRERLRRIAARRLACRDEVDDVVQEAMLRAVTFERLDPAYAGQFLSTVTVRLCADVQRDRARQLRVGVRDALRTVEPGDPHDTLLDQAEAQWLYGECLKLPPRESAVMLARASGMSVKETASCLGVGTKSAEAALTKARHRMRRVAQSAGLGGLLGVFRRLRYAGPSAAVAATVTAVTVGGVIGGTILNGPSRPSPAPADRVVVAAAAPRVTTPRTAVPPPKQVVDGAAATVRQAAPADPKPPPKPPSGTTIETRPIGDPNVVGTREGVKLETEREDETFEETLTRCVSEILTVDPEHPVCDPE